MTRGNPGVFSTLPCMNRGNPGVSYSDVKRVNPSVSLWPFSDLMKEYYCGIDVAEFVLYQLISIPPLLQTKNAAVNLISFFRCLPFTLSSFSTPYSPTYVCIEIVIVT